MGCTRLVRGTGVLAFGLRGAWLRYVLMDAAGDDVGLLGRFLYPGGRDVKRAHQYH